MSQEDIDFYQNFISQLEKYPIYHALNNEKYENYNVPSSSLTSNFTKITIKKIGDSGTGRTILLSDNSKREMTVSNLFAKIKSEFSIPNDNDMRLIFKGKALQPTAADGGGTIRDIIGHDEKEALFYFMPIDKQIFKEEFWSQLERVISDGVVDASHTDALYEGFKNNYRNYIKK